jgi:hypothetical protein
MKPLTVFFVCFAWMFSNGQLPEKAGKPVPGSYCISTMESKLYTMINSYRQRYDLPQIPLSKSLCFVASEHVKDLFFHHPDQGVCNAHSWSAQGNWKAFCYPRDENKKNSVWDKPKELTPYKGKGFEIVYYANDVVVIDSVISFWKSMDYFNSFLMNSGKWQGTRWNAIGIGIHENYACVWFGELPDPEGEPFTCGQEPPSPVSQPKEKPVQEVKKEPVQEVKKEPIQEVKKEPGKPVQVKKDVDKSKATEPKPSNENPNAGTEHYYIIVKGVAPEKDLLVFLKDLKSKGYADSRLVEKNGKQRVAIMEFKEKSLADRALIQVKKIWADAWILKQ